MSGMMKSTMCGTMRVTMHIMYVPLMQNGIHMILMYGNEIHGNLPHLTLGECDHVTADVVPTGHDAGQSNMT